jgi:hypothetical protein
LTCAGPVYSADLSEGDPVESSGSGVANRDWTLNFTTYAWLPWLTGDVTVRGRPFEVEVSPSDVLSALDWSGLPVWMSYMELTNGRLTLFNDIVYAKVEGQGGFEATRTGGVTTLSLAGDVEANYTQTTIEFGAAYNIWSAIHPATARRTTVGLIGGGRYWSQEVDISAELNATLNITGPLGVVDLTRSGSRVIAQSGSIDWIDPFIGLRFQQDIAAGQSVTLRGDVGGFGAGSDFSWQALANYNMEMCRTDLYTVDAYVGYRALSVDYTQGSGKTRYEYDVLQHGPVLGLTMKF